MNRFKLSWFLSYLVILGISVASAHEPAANPQTDAQANIRNIVLMVVYFTFVLIIAFIVWRGVKDLTSEPSDN